MLKMYWDIGESYRPNQKPQDTASDEGLYCLPKQQDVNG